MPDGTTPVLDVQDLKTVFKTRGGQVHAVNDVSFSLRKGELLGVVGESGSGKSVTMMSLLGLLPVPPAEIRGGRVMFDGQDLLQIPAKTLREVRGGKIGFVFQDPMTSLNPVFTVGYQIAEPLRKHMGLSKKAAAVRSRELLELVGIPDAEQRLLDYPHQFSGGMRQRVMIAMAVSCRPKVLIADEPTTALDVTVQAQIFDLLNEIQREFGAAIILITHDMGAISEMADRVAVMYAGRVIEEASADSVLDTPQHPYARGLIDCIPALGKGDTALKEIPGVVPPLHLLGAGCAFAARCAHANARCLSEKPQLINHGHHPSACHAVEEARI